MRVAIVIRGEVTVPRVSVVSFRDTIMMKLYVLCKYYAVSVSSRNFILRGKLRDCMAARPRQGGGCSRGPHPHGAQSTKIRS